MDVGERLKKLMDDRGLNMYSLSKRSGVSWNTIKNFYSRRSRPTVTTLELICNGLGITLAQFFDIDGENVDLTAEQKYLIERWDALSDREKRIISEMLDIMLEKQG